MDQLCTRCVRLSLQLQRSSHGPARVISFRSFRTSIQTRADDKPQTSINDVPPSVRITRSPTTSARPPRTAGTAPVNTPPSSGPVIRRTSAPSANRPAPNGRPQPGTLLRRSGPPSQQGGQLLRRTGPPREGGRSGGPGKGKPPPGKQRRRKTAEFVKAREAEDVEAPEEVVDEYMTKYINRPENPTERLDYNPEPQVMSELQKDWPNTPLSPTGLSASVVQKIEWLARRLPHGYQTPEQLARDFQSGQLTRFESEQEKQQVLKIVKELAQARADDLTDEEGSVIKPEDMSMTDLNARSEKKGLVGQIVKGEIGDLERQRMPFLDSIMRNLRNNETYYKHNTDEFMATIQRLMPTTAQRRPAQQQKKA